jgi:hypothetical protein
VLLWCLIGATYFWVHQNLIYGLSGLPIWFSYAVATGIVLAAFTFKVAFTLEDAPELVTDFARSLLELNFTHGASLVDRARTVFIGIALLAALTVFFILTHRRISVGQNGMSYTPFFLYNLRTLLSKGYRLRLINPLHALHPPSPNPVPTNQHPPLPALQHPVPPFILCLLSFPRNGW